MRQLLTNKKAVLFDLDGTLADSMWVWLKIDEDFGRKYQVTFPETLHEDIEGMSFTETAEYFKTRCGLPQSVEDIKQEWNEMAYEYYRHVIPLKPGAKELLDCLYQHNIKTAICTSNSRTLINAISEGHPVLQKIDCVLTSCEVNVGKPAPDVYLAAAKKVGVDPCDCLVFEDIPQGIMAGKNAGMEVCAVADDFSKGLVDQKKELADYYIQDFNEIDLLE